MRDWILGFSSLRFYHVVGSVCIELARASARSEQEFEGRRGIPALDQSKVIQSKASYVNGLQMSDIDPWAFLIPEKSLGEQVAKDIGAFSTDLLTEEETIYHYTTAAGLKGILTGNCLWATQPAYFSDIREIKYGIDLLAKECRKFASGATKPNPIIQAVIREVSTLVKHVSPYDMYICCFTRKPNDLGQWRGYADNGLGYSIGFDRDSIAEFAIHPLVFKVLYDPLEQRRLCNHLLRLVTGRIQSLIEAAQAKRLIPDEDMLIEWCAGILSTYLEIMTPGLKNQAFKEEEEFRIWVIPNKLRECVPIKMRERNGLMIPFIELYQENRGTLGIKNIIVGPALDFEKAKQGLRHLLDQNGYKKVDILRSDIPYMPS